MRKSFCIYSPIPHFWCFIPSYRRKFLYGLLHSTWRTSFKIAYLLVTNYFTFCKYLNKCFTFIIEIYFYWLYHSRLIVISVLASNVSQYPSAQCTWFFTHYCFLLRLVRPPIITAPFEPWRYLCLFLSGYSFLGFR